MSTPGTQPLTAGWYPDPAGTGGQRFHDGQGWTGQTMHAGSLPKGLGQGFAKLSDWLGRLLGLWGVVYFVLAAVPAYYWMNPPALDLPTQPVAPGSPATQVDGAIPGAALAGMLGIFALYLLAGVLWLVWQYQLAASAPATLRRSPGSHVWWWFVPFANYWIPRSNIGDLWHAYGRQGRGEPAEPTPVVFSVWWFLWIGPGLMYPFFVLVLLRASTLDAAVSAVFGFWTLTLVAGCLSAVTARLVVRDLSWRALLYWSDAR